MTTPEQAPPQIDIAEVARTLGHLEEGMRQMGQRFDRLDENQRDTNRRLDENQRDTNRRLEENQRDTNRRLDETNQRIDRLVYVNIAGLVVITGTLLGGLLTLAFIG